MKLILIITALLAAVTMSGQTKNNNDKLNDMEVKHLTTAEFKQLVYNYEANPGDFKFEGSLPTIVDFFATWCGPCKRLSPIMDELANEYAGKINIYKVDVDQNEELSQVFGIRSIPTLLFIPKEGQPSISAGAPSKAQLKEIIEKMIK